MTKQARNELIKNLFIEGVSGPVIAERFEITRERVRQILAKQGLGRKDGGRYRQTQRRIGLTQQEREANCQSRYGYSWVEHQKVLQMDRDAKELGISLQRTIMYRYRRQEASARTQGVPFSLKLAEWWKVWRESGKWALCGRGTGFYVMGRLDTRKGYELGNVAIMEYRVMTKKKRNKQMWVQREGAAHE